MPNLELCIVCHGTLDAGREIEGLCKGCYDPADLFHAGLIELAGALKRQMRELQPALERSRLREAGRVQAEQYELKRRMKEHAQASTS